ncbi:unnamed protein product [Spirodela intermedia]|uniref:Cathepsin propeptide inhibitor domain-containing protein n=1 Tax=Spirodela intermedia TaxID=51605 RepID=A0A7I8JA93_SPIIN|nr:unnamed protein product [Spirodela intermedia]CAA6667019.1 unnamed protein product [Spirodela intermedia]
MKTFVLSASLVVALVSSMESNESLSTLYERWRENMVSLRHFDIFKENISFTHEFNNKDEPYKLKLNKFIDMPEEEFRTFIGLAGNDDPMVVTGAASGDKLFEIIIEVGS